MEEAFHTEETAHAKDLWHSKREKLKRNQCSWKREARGYMAGGKIGVKQRSTLETTFRNFVLFLIMESH